MMNHFSLNDLAPISVMGILNVTPDSFSDGGVFSRVDDAVNAAITMAGQGASIIDIGGESTRPGAESVSLDEEMRRVLPVIEGIRRVSDIPISIDTSKPVVMRAAVEAGANMINDVNALRAPGAVDLVAELQVPVCLMHMQGQPRQMQNNPRYDDLVTQVSDFLFKRAELCVEAGIKRDEIALDPGFGFGKTVEHNFQLFAHLPALIASQYPVLVGISRKSMLGAITDKPIEERLAASIAGATMAAYYGARIIRVHDVDQTVDAVKFIHAMNKK